jgi:hypothetical protein
MSHSTHVGFSCPRLSEASVFNCSRRIASPKLTWTFAPLGLLPVRIASSPDTRPPIPSDEFGVGHFATTLSGGVFRAAWDGEPSFAAS